MIQPLNHPEDHTPTPALEEEIPACPHCKGDGCKACLGTGLTSEDCDFAGLARFLDAAKHASSAKGLEG